MGNKRETGFEPATFSLARPTFSLTKEYVVFSNYNRLSWLFPRVENGRENIVFGLLNRLDREKQRCLCGEIIIAETRGASYWFMMCALKPSSAPDARMCLREPAA